MFKQIKGFIAGVVFAALIAALSAHSIAALVTKTIQVSSGANILIDGARLEPKDAKGNPVETFVYNGTTYVPLRAVSEAFGKLVSYDGGTQTVSISNNVFINDTRNSAPNKVSLTPNKVYYDGDKLVAEMFVDNGFAVPVYNLKDITIALSNGSVEIAKGTFSGMSGAMIAANSYITWKFTFSKDAVLAKGADLSRIINEYSIKSSH